MYARFSPVKEAAEEGNQKIHTLFCCFCYSSSISSSSILHYPPPPSSCLKSGGRVPTQAEDIEPPGSCPESFWVMYIFHSGPRYVLLIFQTSSFGYLLYKTFRFRNCVCFGTTMMPSPESHLEKDSHQGAKKKHTQLMYL